MNSKGYRANNGEGTIYSTIQKVKRKKFLDEICVVCKDCMTRCNREQFEKCDKCKNCKEECLRYCDRFYCQKLNIAQITVNGKQITVANEKKKNVAVEKKKKAQAETLSNSYIEKNGITILELIRSIDNKKFNSNIIKGNTKFTNKFLYQKLETSSFAYKSIQETSATMIQDFLDSLTEDLSQSEIRKYYDKINVACKYAIEKGIINNKKNPMSDVSESISSKKVEPVEAFTLEEEKKLIIYICTHKLVKSSKCAYNDRTIRNLILIALFTLMRCGELGALKLDEDVDLETEKFIVDETLSRDEHGHTIIGDTTKTGTKNKQAGKSDTRIVPFNLFDKDLLLLILLDQIENSKSNKNNKENLLFCRNDGKYLAHTSITNIFKRICRDAGVKLKLTRGCHIHMTRHTRHY